MPPPKPLDPSELAETLPGSPQPASPLPADAKVSREEPGRYGLGDELGRGGMGRVYVAFDGHVGRDVAFKELTGSTDPSAARRFLREARITGQLEHPNIVPVYEVGQGQNGALYYTMRLVRGRTLAAALDGCRSLGDRLKLLGAFWNLCNAVAYAHDRGVVHRDLKPDNVMVGQFGETVLIDWGVARRTRVTSNRPTLLGEEPEPTQGGAVGTPAYMSPEQASGELRLIDERSDVWGLGAVLYEILTGAPPYDAPTTSQTVQKVRRDPLVPVRERCAEAPPELAAVAEKALRRAREERYQSAGELAAEIDAYISGGRVRAHAYSSWELARHFASRHRAVAALGAALLASVLVALVAVSRAWRDERGALQAAELHLARAYEERARRHLADLDFPGVRRWAAESLLHNPASPRAAGHDPAFARGNREARELEVQAASLVFQAASMRLVERERELPAHDAVSAVAYSADGALLLTGTLHRGEVTVFDAATGQRLREIAAPRSRVWELAISPDGTLIARGSDEHALDVWDARTGAPRWRTEPSLGSTRKVLFSRDGALLLASFRGSSPRIWNAATGALVKSLDGVGGAAQLALSRDGTRLATADRERIQIWSVPAFEPLHAFASGAGPVQAIAFTPDGASLVTATTQAALQVVDAADGRVRLHIQGREPVRSLDITPDGARLVGEGGDGIQLWDLATGRRLLTLAGEAVGRAFAISPDGRHLAIGRVDEKVQIHRFVSDSPLRTFAAHTERITAVAFSRDGRHAATGTEGTGSTVAIWDVASQAPIARLAGHTRRVNAVAFQPDGRRVATCSRDQTARIWDVATGRAELRLDVGEQLEAVAWSPDGAILATAGLGRVVHLFDARTGEEKARLEGHQEVVGGIAFSPDGARLGSASNDGTVRVWDLATRQAVHVLKGHREWAWALAWSADGLTLASGGRDGEILLWDPARGALSSRLPGHRGWVNQLHFSGDGRALASCSDDGTARVWDVAAGEPRLIFRAQKGVESVDLSADGAWLLFGVGATGQLYPARLPAAGIDPAAVLAHEPAPEE